uniref:Uncharacterized protein n=1 Tax=Anguilla anguilla TaxID=7936 RepID=A0A0E9PAM0_ANGAN
MGAWYYSPELCSQTTSDCAGKKRWTEWECMC